MLLLILHSDDEKCASIKCFDAHCSCICGSLKVGCGTQARHVISAFTEFNPCLKLGIVELCDYVRA